MMKFINEINKVDSDAEVNYEYTRARLQDTLEKLTILDDSIHDLLSDAEYDADVLMCEEYVRLLKVGDTMSIQDLRKIIYISC